jgi:chromosome partitioning protein
MRSEKPLGILIAVGNQKGGVGKTTNTVQIAAALGYRGYRCLIIDLVPDAGATRHLGVRQNSFAGSLELMTTEETIESLVITEKMPQGVHLIASRRQLAELDKIVSKFMHPTELLERPLHRARELYDFVFLDTAPEAGAIATVAAYCTADWFLLSAFPHPLSLGGLSDAFSDISDVRKRKNPNLQVLGVVFTNVDGRTKLLRAELEATVRKVLPGREFQTVISQAIILPEVSGRGKTLFQLPKFSRLAVAQQYLRLSVEVEHRVCNRDAFLAGTLGPPDFTVLNGLGENEAEPEQGSEQAVVVNG